MHRVTEVTGVISSHVICKMDYRDISLAETTTPSQTGRDQLDLVEEDVSDVPTLTVAYVTSIERSFYAFSCNVIQC